MKLPLLVNSARIPGQPGATFKALFDAFLLRCRAKALAPGTLTWYQDKLKPFIAFLAASGVKEAGEVSPAHLRAYIGHLQASGQCSGTIYRAYTGLGTFFTFLLKEGFIQNNPMALVEKPKRVKKMLSAFTMDQVRALLAQFDPDNFPLLRTRTLIILLLDSGLRISEALSIRKSDIYFAENTIKVMGKGGKERLVPFGNTSKQALMQYLMRIGEIPGQELLFLNRFGGGLNRRTIQRQLQLYAKKAGIKGVRPSPHTLRHTFATQYILNGGDAFSLQKILGHSTLDMVRVYVDMANSNMTLQHRKFSPMDRLGEVAGIKRTVAIR
jgi:integrase/recombinase XerD